jgi:hypothetical protein
VPGSLVYQQGVPCIPTEFLNHFWIQMPDAAVLEVKRPLHGGFTSETAKQLTAIYLTDIPQRTQFSVRV